MFDALSIGATGMQAQQVNVDTIANNLVNMNTTGFKKGRVSFTDLVSLGAIQDVQGAGRDGSVDGPGLLGAPSFVGSGVGISEVGKVFSQGAVNPTGSVWDVAIQGDGFLQVEMADGTLAYTRGGTLKVNPEGLLSTQSGQVLSPKITIPANATSMAITADGTVLVALPNQADPIQVGQLQMVHFENPGALSAQGDSLYKATKDSGEAISGIAGQDGLGTLQQGFVEGSNVKMVDEMVNLMLAQRSYEMSAKVVQTADELMGMVNNLRK